MTIVNICLTPERALVATDTLNMAPDGTRTETNKLFPMVAANAVIATCGVSLFAKCLNYSIHSHGGSLDKLVAIMPEALTESWKLTDKLARARAIDFVAPNPA